MEKNNEASINNFCNELGSLNIYDHLDKRLNLDPNDNYELLGVILDNKLNRIEHIGYVKNKVAKGIGIICKARNFFPKKVLLTLYNTFIFPYLIYCVEIWGCAKKKRT